MELRFLFSAHRLIVIYISTKFHENILHGIKVIELFFYRVKVFVLCTSSDGDLYFYKVS